MRFWDSSAIVPLLVHQPQTDAVTAILDEDEEMVVWWSTPIECASALARLRRDEVIPIETESRVLALLREFGEVWHEIRPSEEVRSTAMRLLRTHPLRTADALQLAAALTWSGAPRGEVLVTYDSRLATAAQLEGFMVAPRTA